MTDMNAGNASENLNWGFVGTGNISHLVAEEVSAIGSGRLVAVASRDLSRAQAFAAQHGFSRSYDNLPDLLADPEVDAIYIALPHELHQQSTLLAMDAGKHVLCEKPLVTRASDVDALLEHPNAAKLVVMEGFMLRQHPQWQWIENCIKSGKIGTVQFVQSFFSFEKRPPNETFDLMYDVGCYCAHFSRLAFQDKPVAATAQAFADSLISASISFPTGIAQFSVSADTVNAGTIHILGSGGSIELLDPIRPPASGARVRFSKNGSEPENLEFGPFAQFGQQFAHIADVVRNGVPRVISLEDSRENARCIDAIFRSVSSGTHEAIY